MGGMIENDRSTVRTVLGWMTGAVALGLVLSGWSASPAHSQDAGPAPVGTYAFVARADNPVDALAAGAVAGQLGAPVFLTDRSTLSDQAAQGLAAADPEVVVLAGGTVALSAEVEQQVGRLLPDATVRRFAGGDRIETTRLVNELTGQLGVDRPVVTGGTVAGDVGIDGVLTLDGTDVAATLSTLTARIDQLEGELTSAVDELEGKLTAATDRIATLEATLAGVTRTTIDQRDTLRLSGMNLQVVNGRGFTSGTPNGVGNIIVGYNAKRPTGSPPAQRSGSHYLVVGDEHHWTSFGGLLAGERNTVSNPWATVTGGWNNTASGSRSSVSGGSSNTASGNSSSISGGSSNAATGIRASILGGQSKTVSTTTTCHPAC